MRSRCSRAEGRRSMRSAGWPTTCAARRPSARSPVINRNINFTNVCYVGCFCAFAQREVDAESCLTLDQVADRAEEAWTAGATERCACRASIHHDLLGFYFDLLDVIRDRTPGHAHPRVQPDGGPERCHEAGYLASEFLQECQAHGLGTIPGTAAEIRTTTSAGCSRRASCSADTWEEIVRTAHDLGIRSSSTIMFGHVDAPPHWVAHIRRLGRIQDDTGEVHGVRAAAVRPSERADLPGGQGAPGATSEENLRMHAVARILLDGRGLEHPGVRG